jgi:hypothetical protein
MRPLATIAALPHQLTGRRSIRKEIVVIRFSALRRASRVQRASTVLGVLSVLAVTLAGVQLPAQASQPSWPMTAKVVIRPVNVQGGARPGYQVIALPAERVDCTHGEPSVGAVSPNIQYCFPTAANAEVCWNSGLPHRVLCFPDLAKKELVRMPRRGPFAATPLTAPLKRAPLRIVFFSGTSCSMAFNGTYPVRTNKIRSAVMYRCSAANLYVWARPQAPHSGVNESNGTWTVYVGKPTGPLVVRHIKIAQFVGTSRS